MKKLFVFCIGLIVVFGGLALWKNIEVKSGNLNTSIITHTYKINNKKHTIIHVNGLEKTIITKTYHSNFGYKIDYDIDLFEAQRSKNKDVFTYKKDSSVYYSIERIDKKDYLFESTSNVIYKTNDDIYIKILIHCSDNPEYLDGIYQRILFSTKSIKFE